MKPLTFTREGLCYISLAGLPRPDEIEGIVEEYVSGVELLPYPLKLIFIDISKLVHMEIRCRRIFSELLTQASRHYNGQVEMVVAGGSLNLRRFIQLFCKGIGFNERSHFFEDIDEAEVWTQTWLNPGFKTTEKRASLVNQEQ